MTDFVRLIDCSRFEVFCILEMDSPQQQYNTASVTTIDIVFLFYGIPARGHPVESTTVYHQPLRLGPYRRLVPWLKRRIMSGHPFVPVATLQ